MKIKNTLVALMLVVSLVPLLFSSFLHFSNSAATVERDAGEKLWLTAYGAHKNILEFFSSKKAKAIETASDRFLAQETERLNNVSSGGLEAEGANLSDYLRKKKSLDASATKMHVMGPSGRIIASTEAGEMGSFKHANTPHFLRGLNKAYVEDAGGHEAEMEISVSAPVKNDNGAVLGVVEYNFGIDALKSILAGDLKRVRGEKPGDIDVFVANQDAKLIFHSGNHGAQEGKNAIELAIKICEAGGGFNVNRVEENGKKEFISVECIKVEDDWQWAFAAEQDEEEALAPVNALASTSLIIAAVTALVAGLIAAASTRRISAALESLTESINEVSRGNFGAEIPPYVKEYEDEIGELARAFDRTIVSLKIAMRQSAPQLKMEKLMAEKELETKGQMLDLANDAVFLIDRAGAIHYANKKAQEFCKCGPEGLQSGKCKLDEFVAPEQKRIVPKKISEVLEKGSTRFQIAFAGKERITIAEANAKALELKGNKMLLVVARDVSEREELVKEKLGETEKFKRIFELSPEAIVLVGKDRKIIDVNPRCLDWLGYERGEIIGKSFLELPFLSAATKALMAAKFIQRMAGVRLSPYEIDMIPKAGGKVRVRIVGTAVAGKEGSPAFDLVMMSKIGNTGKNGRQ